MALEPSIAEGPALNPGDQSARGDGQNGTYQQSPHSLQRESAVPFREAAI
jgi:hypothetical protein